MVGMLKLLILGSFVAFIVISASADEIYSHCSCDDEGGWSLASILECQRVSDFLIAIAYFSIPIELLYFISCSDVPFKWVLVQFIAFIVLCGLTHLLNGWTYYGPHSFQLMMALTVAKILTALVSFATAITLLTLIPLLLKIKVREVFLTQNVLELDQEVWVMKRQKEASLHVRMLTNEIRKTLDKHTILYTTLVELSKTLDLQNCAVWMPNWDKTEMNLTHELNRSSREELRRSLPINDLEVLEITKTKGVRILRQDSVLGFTSSGGSGECGSVAAIRVPLLRISNFKGGTPEFVETAYGILVLVLPNENDRGWSHDEMEIVEVVADQVAVALSHAAVLEESRLMREKLEERNRVLQQAKENAMMASQARNAFQKVMNNGMRRPMHSISGLLLLFQDDNMNSDQKIIVETMVRTSAVLSTLINDAMDISAKDDGRFPLDMRPFELHSMIREASCLVKCLSVYKGFVFSTDVQSLLPNQVAGDEKRTFQVLLHMVGHLLDVSDERGSVTFRVLRDGSSEGRNDRLWGTRRPGTDDHVNVKFEIEISLDGTPSVSSLSMPPVGGRRLNNNSRKEGLSFTMCKKLVQMLQGGIWMSPVTEGQKKTITLLMRFQKQSSFSRQMFEIRNPPEQRISSSMFRGLQVILADDDDVNRMVTKRLLEKLGCQVTAVSSGFQCLSALGPSVTSFQVVMLDLHMPEMDGFEVAMRIRKFRSRSWPLIIALTASTEEQVSERCREVGMNGLIRKPVLLQGLADELRKVLQRAGERS
ncbi:histidine kinase receptor of two-component system [Lithospermum erythrorhizon]|uniref:Ethylene receptor n=1 Tax=Lithospermum erythrorhizon TaxID=34254 RepID=A0AAV3PQR7_LITER